MIERYEIEIYETGSGKKPFESWIETIRDQRTVAKIQSRLDRAILGNLGDHKFLRDGVSEMRVDCGPGYRIYFGKVGAKIILLLCAGIKRSQDTDIAHAARFLEDYLNRGKDRAKK